MAKPRIAKYTREGNVTHVTAVELIESVTVGTGASARQREQVIARRQLRTAIAVPDEAGEARTAALNQLRQIVAGMRQADTPAHEQAVEAIETELEQEAGR